MATVNEIRQGDVIESIVIGGDTSELFASLGGRVEEWNRAIGK